MRLQSLTSTINLYQTNNVVFGTDFIDFLTSKGVYSVNADLNGLDLEDIYSTKQFSSALEQNNRVLSTKTKIVDIPSGEFNDDFNEDFDI